MIVWNNRASGVTNSASSTVKLGSGASADWAYSLVGNSGGSTNWNTGLGGDSGGNLDADPQFLSGLDPASAPVAGGDHALRVSSPAINQGNDLFALDSYDLAGNDRIYNDPLLQFDYVDMGAYETYDDGSDADGDHLTDYAEVVDFGSNPSLPDTDGDGSTDGDEAFVGSDLLNGNSVFAISIQNTGANEMTISWQKFKSGLLYELSASTNLVSGTWFPVGSTTSSNLVDSATDDAIFYRVNVTVNN